MSRDALIVGINQYQNINLLQLPAQDAEAIAQLLGQYGNFKITRLPESINDKSQLQIGKHSEVTTAQLKQSLVKLFKPDSHQAPETALFYFAGHGFRDTLGVDEGYLCTSDCNPHKSFCGISLRWLHDLLQESPVKQKIIWLDCCHSGSLLNFHQANPSGRNKGRDFCFIAASRDFEEAYEEIAGNHGVLTKALLQGLNPTAKGKVDNFELATIIRDQLEKETQSPVFANSGEAIILTQSAQVPVKVTTKTATFCPYKGLQYFDCNDTDPSYFYGRELLTDRLVTQASNDSFIAIIGASGSGKSSLARAGLIHQLQQGQRLSGSEKWKFLILCPGEHPLQNLATSFIEPDLSPINRATQLQEAEQLLNKGAEGLKQLVLAHPAPKLLLLIDQFEEVFTLCQNETERKAFFACLLDALELTQRKLCVVITLRADFMRQATEQNYSGLALQIEQHLVAVTPMSEEEIISAVVKPAKQVGLNIDSLLLAEILVDIKTAPAHLPLLQYALTQLWEQRQSDALSLADYIKLGRLGGALENRAEKTFAELNEDQQSAAKWLFLSVAQLGEGREDTRKRAFKQDLISTQHPESLITQTLQKLSDARLLVINRSEDEVPQTVVDIAHEALIQHWGRLRGWIDEERDFKKWRDNLNQTIEDWQHSKQDKGLLLQGGKLLTAQEKQQAYKQLLNSKEMDFISASLKQHKRKRFWLISSISSVIVLVSAFAVTSYWLKTKAEESEARARIEQKRAEDSENEFKQFAVITVRNLADQSEQVVNKYLDDILKTGLRKTLLVLLEPLVKETESMDAAEKQHWQDILPSLTDENVKKLAAILFIEKVELTAVDKEYQQAVKDLTKKHSIELVNITKEKVNSKNPSSYLEAADAIIRFHEINNTNIDEASTYLSIYIKLVSLPDPRVYYLYGNYYKLKANNKDAIKNYKKAYEQGYNINNKIKYYDNFNILQDYAFALKVANAMAEESKKQFEDSVNHKSKTLETDKIAYLKSVTRLLNAKIASSDLMLPDYINQVLQVAEEIKPKDLTSYFGFNSRLVSLYYKSNNATKAADLLSNALNYYEQSPLKNSINKAWIATKYGELSWYLLLTAHPENAINLARKGLEYDPNQTWIITNMAHGYMLTNQLCESEKIHLKMKNEKISEAQKIWKEVILDDFKTFAEKNIIHPNIAKIKNLLEADKISSECIK